MNEAQKLIKAELPGGFAEYGAAEMAARQRIFDAIVRVYRRYGFVPLETSIVQRTVVLKGEQGDNILFETRKDTSTDSATESLRFDLTVPLARYVAEHMNELTFPFARYEQGYVFRGETAQIGKGRLNGFIQFDADIVGAPVGTADATIILCMADVMQEIGVERFMIKVNNRKVLDGFAAKLGFAPGSSENKSVLRIMDKADKIGMDGVLAEMRTAFGDVSPDLVREFMTLCDGLTSNDERLAKLAAYFGSEGIGAEGVAELQLVATYLVAGGIRSDAWEVDVSMARGLGYYTGTVFETVLPDAPSFGSVYSGGRYDYLLERFTGAGMPCIGASVGVSRLFDALQSIGKAGEPEPAVDVFILSMDASLTERYFALAAEARKAGLRVEVGMSHQDMSNKSQMRIALDRRAPVIVFFGGNEAESGTVQLKDSRTRAQVTVPLAEWVAKAKEILGA